MHYFKKNIGDYAKKAGRLSMLQHGSYTLLIDACYDREQFPTHDEAIEWTWASTKEEVEAVEFVLRKFFTLEDGRYVEQDIRSDIAEYHAKAETNKRIANERETKRKENSTNRAQAVNEAPPNYKPRTSNQEPSSSKAKAAPKARKPTKTAIPADFCLSDAVLAWAAKARHTDLPAHFDSFVRKAKAGGYMYVDWDQALQNAIADDWAKLRAPQARGSPPGGYQTANDKAKSLADRLTGKTRNEPTFDFIDINAIPP